MNYYPFHLGDYTAHTAHLELLEDLAYRRMLDAYYLREWPLPADPAEVARLIRMRQHLAEVEAVLREFFMLSDDGWRHQRCDDEITRMQDKQAKARASAAASVNARRTKAEPALNGRKANAQRTLNERSTDAELPTPTPTPVISEPIGSENKPGKRAAVIKPDSVSQAVWDGFLAIRKAKRAPISAVALAGIEREAARAGKTLNEALTICCERGWQAFRADWVESATAGGRKVPSRENFDAVQYGETGLL